MGTAAETLSREDAWSPGKYDSATWVHGVGIAGWRRALEKGGRRNERGRRTIGALATWAVSPADSRERGRRTIGALATWSVSPADSRANQPFAEVGAGKSPPRRYVCGAQEVQEIFYLRDQNRALIKSIAELKADKRRLAKRLDEEVAARWKKEKK